MAAYWRTNVTMRQSAPLFGVSECAADRIIDHLGPMLALQPRKRFRKGTVLIVDGTRDPGGHVQPETVIIYGATLNRSRNRPGRVRAMP